MKTRNAEERRFGAGTIGIRVGAALACLALLAPCAHAAIVYVDATTSNTTDANGVAHDEVGQTWFASSSDNDNKWNIRTSFANGGGIFNADEYENVPVIRVQTAVANETYDVYVFFWDDVGSDDPRANWDISAGLSASSLSNFEGDSASNASTLTFSTDPMFTEDNRIMRYGYLGQATVSDGTLEVYIDDYNKPTDDVARTWFDGIGYAVIPEPSSAVLVLLTGVAMTVVLHRRDRPRG